MNNPFIGYGKPIQEDRLVGRQKEIAQITDRLESNVSLSIIGQRRVGKTSLIINAIQTLKRKSPSSTIVSCDLSPFPKITNFFDYILEELSELISENNELPHNFEKHLNAVEDDYEAYRRFRRSLKVLKKAGFNTQIVIDEFDSIRRFENATQIIQWLREIIDKGFETGTSIVFISRRSLYSIESQIADVSNLDGVCEKFYIKPLDDNGLREMVERHNEIWNVDEENFKRLCWYTGGHPYLAEMILCQAWDEKSISQVEENFVCDIFEFYEHLKKILEEDGLFDQLIKAAIGPHWNLSLEAISKLERYGMIKKDLNHQRYDAWSEHFQLYLEKCSRDKPIWELWSQTEILIRDTIQNICEKSFGNEWTEKLKRRKNALPKLIQDCEERMHKELRSFGSNASEKWLDYTYPNDLWSIISWEWQSFQDLFQGKEQQKNKNYWAERFQLLAKIRNPLAHNRTHSVSEYDMTLTQAYCQEIKSRLVPSQHETKIEQ